MTIKRQKHESSAGYPHGEVVCATCQSFGVLLKAIADGEYKREKPLNKKEIVQLDLAARQHVIKTKGKHNITLTIFDRE